MSEEKELLSKRGNIDGTCSGGKRVGKPCEKQGCSARGLTFRQDSPAKKKKRKGSFTRTRGLQNELVASGSTTKKRRAKKETNWEKQSPCADPR